MSTNRPQLRIAFASSYDPEDTAAFSGRNVGMIAGLRKHSDALYKLGPLGRPVVFPVLWAKKKFYSICQPDKQYYMLRDVVVARSYSRELRKKLLATDANVVLSPNSRGSQPIAYLDCEQPLVIWTDATLAGALDFYPGLSRERICTESLRDGLNNERAAFQRCSLAIFKSMWAAETAFCHYGFDPAKTLVVPGGPGLTSDLTPEKLSQVIESRPRDRCRLLFVGNDWKRKGGDIAVEAARKLNKSGLPTELILVGKRPVAAHAAGAFVHREGLLSRTNSGQLERLLDLFKSAHFLILPTRAEAMGMVLCEASSFGLPSIVADVGGVSSAVRDGINGRLLPEGSGPDAYCEAIQAIFENRSDYEALCRSSFAEFQKRLNWDVSARIVAQALRDLIAKTG